MSVNAVRTVEISGTVNDASQAILGYARRGWAVTITVHTEADTAHGALEIVDDRLKRACIPIIHGTRWKVRRLGRP